MQENRRNRRKRKTPPEASQADEKQTVSSGSSPENKNTLPQSYSSQPTPSGYSALEIQNELFKLWEEEAIATDALIKKFAAENAALINQSLIGSSGLEFWAINPPTSENIRGAADAICPSFVLSARLPIFDSKSPFVESQTVSTNRSFTPYLSSSMPSNPTSVATYHTSIGDRKVPLVCEPERIDLTGEFLGESSTSSSSSMSSNPTSVATHRTSIGDRKVPLVRESERIDLTGESLGESSTSSSSSVSSNSISIRRRRPPAEDKKASQVPAPKRVDRTIESPAERAKKILDQVLSDPLSQLYGECSKKKLEPILTKKGSKNTLITLSKCYRKLKEKFGKKKTLEIAYWRNSSLTLERMLHPDLWRFFARDTECKAAEKIYELADHDKGSARLQAIISYGEGLLSFGFSHQQIFQLVNGKGGGKKLQIVHDYYYVLRALGLSTQDIFNLAAIGPNTALGTQNIVCIYENKLKIFAKSIESRDIIATLTDGVSRDKEGLVKFERELAGITLTEIEIYQASLGLAEQAEGVRREVSEYKRRQTLPRQHRRNSLAFTSVDANAGSRRSIPTTSQPLPSWHGGSSSAFFRVSGSANTSIGRRNSASTIPVPEGESDENIEGEVNSSSQ